MDLTALIDYDRRHNTQIARLVNDLVLEGQYLAPKGTLHLIVVAEHFKKLSLEEVQHFLDPEAFHSEIEEIQTERSRLGMWNAFRNILSLSPLIATWLGLFLASSAYQQYWTAPQKNAAAEPFLQLWQERFHNIALFGFFPFVPTFAEIALFDVILLGLLLLCILRIQAIERKAQRTFDQFTRKLREVTGELFTVVATEGISSMDRIIQTLDVAFQKSLNELIKSVKTISQTDTTAIADALKEVVADTLKASEDVARAAQTTIVDLNSDLRDLVDKFHNDLGRLGSDIVTYNEQVKKLTDASTQLATASSNLATNANDLTKGTQAYADVGKDISHELSSLNVTQQQLVTRVNDTQQDVVSKVAAFASNLDSAAKATEAAAKELGQFTKADIQKMTQSVSLVADRVADAANNLIKVQSSLSQVDKYLQGSLTQTDRHLQTSLGYVDQHLQNSLMTMDRNLQITSRELQKAAHTLASMKGVNVKKGIWPFRRP